MFSELGHLAPALRHWLAWFLGFQGQTRLTSSAIWFPRTLGLNRTCTSSFLELPPCNQQVMGLLLLHSHVSQHLTINLLLYICTFPIGFVSLESPDLYVHPVQSCSLMHHHFAYLCLFIVCPPKEREASLWATKAYSHWGTVLH